MNEPTDDEVLGYVADMTEQLAALTRDAVVAALLHTAARAARERSGGAKDAHAHREA